MHPGTFTLIIYLAGMGPAPRDPFRHFSLRFSKVHRVHVPLHHPLFLKMPSMEACLRVADSERARGNKAGCTRSSDDAGPRDYNPEPGPS
jgi:hypothetical protein